MWRSMALGMNDSGIALFKHFKYRKSVNFPIKDETFLRWATIMAEKNTKLQTFVLSYR